MVHYVIAALMVGLTVFLTLTRRRRAADILIAAVTITVSEVANIDEVYLFVDAGLGGSNLTDLLANLLLVVGITALSTATIRAIRGPAYRPALPLILLAATVAVMVTCFTQVRTSGSTARLIADFGDQPLAAAYNLAEFTFISYVMAVTAWALITNLRSIQVRAFRVGSLLTASGCFTVLVMYVLICVMDVAHVVGEHTALTAVQSIYGAVDVLGMLLLCSGLSVLGFARGMHPVGELEKLDSELDLVLRRAEGTASRRLSSDVRGDDVRTRLHWKLTDVYDYVADGAFSLTPADEALLRRVDVALAPDEAR